MVLLDANILIDIFGQDPDWWQWSLARMREARQRGPLYINDIVYAESSTRFASMKLFEATLERAEVIVLPIPRPALFLAGKAFLDYRRAGGSKASILPDFFIGAHAAIEQLAVITRDTRRYRHYFPTVELIAPE
ncbi:type II toxin-antitoxin system VapC family toxin [soil metagenome]